MRSVKLRLLALVLAALLLAGCGQSGPSVQSDAATPERTAQSAGGGLFSFLNLGARHEKSEATIVKNTGFQIKFEGDKVAGTGEDADGVYRVTATKTDGEAWHVKLECNYPTVPGREYHVTYRFHSNVAGSVKFGDNQEFKIKAGDNTVTGKLVATGDPSYLDLQLGMLSPFTMEFQEIEVEEYVDNLSYENALPKPLDFEDNSVLSERHDDGYSPDFKRTHDQVTINYYSTAWENDIWKARLYVFTGMIPQEGNRYRIRADVQCEKDLDFEVLFNRGEQEKGYGALYAQHVDAGQVKTIEQILNIPSSNYKGDEIVLQFSLGKAPEGTDITVSKVCVEKIVDDYTNVLPKDYALDKQVLTGKTLHDTVPVAYTDIPLKGFSYSGTDTVFSQNDDGYEVSLSESKDSATLKITKAPENAEDRGVWKAKLFAATGVTPEAGTTYKVKFDLKSEKDQAEYEVCFDGSSENAYGAPLYGRSLTAGGTDHVEFSFTPAESKGELKLRLQMGKTDTAQGNTVTISNLSVESMKVETTEVASVSYQTGRNVREEHGDGIEQTVSASGSSATLNVTKAREGGGLWSSRLFVNTGVTPEAGQRYRVTADMSTNQAFDGAEIVCDNGGAEAGYGKQPGLSLSGSGTYTADFIAPDSGCGELVLRFQLGNSPAGNTVTVSNIRVQKITTETTNVDLGGFAYPVTTEPQTTTVPAGWAAQSVSLSATSVAYDGFEQNAYMDGGEAVLDITKGREGGGIWSSRLNVGTGVVLEPGQKYAVSAVLHSKAAIGEFQCLYSNGVEENDDYNLGGKGYQDGSYGLSVGAGESTTVYQEFVAPERSQYNPLVLRFQLGESPAPNTVTVSNVVVSKWVEEHEETTGGSTQNNSFFMDLRGGAQAEITGNGGSASARIITPGDDWQVKLYADTGVTLQSGKSYEISFSVNAPAACSAVFKRDGGEETDFGSESIAAGSQTITHYVTPETAGRLQIILKIGNLPAGSTVTISGIAIKETSETLDTNLMTDSLSAWAPVNFWAHEDYSASISNDGSSATLNINSAANQEVWKVKLFVETGASLQAGKNYRISADVQSSADTGYEICYNNGEVEKGVGAQYGLNANSTKQTVIYEVTPESAANLILQFSLGNAPAPCAFTVSNVKVEEVTETSSSNVLPSFSYDSVGSIDNNADPGYICSMEKSASSVNFHIQQAPAEGRNPWNVKLNLHTGFTPEAGKGYQISFDIDSKKSQDLVEFFYDGSSEHAYGALYEQSLPAGKKTVSYTIMPGGSNGELTVQIRLGKTDSTSGNDYTISNVKLQEVTFTTRSTPEKKDAAELYVHETYKATLEKTEKTATVKVTKVPEKDQEPWKIKLFIDTGVTLKADQKYRISFEAVAGEGMEIPFEVCYNKDGEEKALGAKYGLTATQEAQVVEYIVFAPADAHLVIQCSLGNAKADTAFTVSNVKVEKAGKTELVSDTIYVFKEVS